MANADFRKCALQPLECTSPEDEFRSARWLRLNNPDSAARCYNQTNIREIQSMGRCNSAADRFICTSDASGCRFAAVFEPLATDCNLVQDFYPSNEFSNAHYGFCVSDQGVEDFYAGKSPAEDAVFCAWRFKECDGVDGNGEYYSWRTADVFSAEDVPECHCDDVLTGACVNDNDNDDLYCAVSKDSCGGDLGFSYVPVLDLKVRLDVTCKLCSTIPPELYNTEKATVDEYPEKVPDKEKEPSGDDSGLDEEDSPNESDPNNEVPSGDDSGLDEEDSPNESDPNNATSVAPLNAASSGDNDDDKNENIGILIGIIVGSVAGVLIICAIVIKVFRKKRSQKAENEDKTKAVAGDDFSVNAPSVA